MKLELETLKKERDILKQQLEHTKVMSEWLRIRCNAMEMERAQLLEKAYGIRVLVPEVAAKRMSMTDLSSFNSDLFDDMGEEKAKEQGMPLYGDKTN